MSQPARVVIVMGVSGAGKSSIAEGLRDALGWAFQEGDLLHPPSNVQKMHAGIALTDEDRAPWLAAIKEWIDRHLDAGQNGLVTCSALKRRYRDFLIAGRPNVRVLYLKAPAEVLEQRVSHRPGHFMPASLLDSQLKTLEEPGPEEQALVVRVDGTQQASIAAALAAIRSA
jgi:carbohydrate kinase (thermoresistant glucokinase family)